MNVGKKGLEPTLEGENDKPRKQKAQEPTRQPMTSSVDVFDKQFQKKAKAKCKKNASKFGIQYLEHGEEIADIQDSGI